MDSKIEKPLTIGYGGGLAFYQPGKAQPSRFVRKVRDWFWTYRVRNLDASTRSAYYLLKGVEHLKQQNPDAVQRLCIRLWGLIDPRTEAQAEAMGLGEVVEIQGYMSRADSLRLLQSCDVLFLPLESSHKGQRPLFIPGKVYEYLKVRKPVLALAGPSDCADILVESGLGIVVSPYDTKGVAEALQGLVSQKEQLASIYIPDDNYIDHFRFDRLAHRVSRVFDEVLGGSGT